MSVITDPAHLDRLIDRHLQLGEVRRRLVGGGAASGPAPAAVTPGPWIAISRQLGASAGAIATGLSTKLGWQVFDRQILEAIARETHIRERLLDKMDEVVPSALADLAAHLIVPGHPGFAGYTVELTKVLAAIAAHGQAVIMGRGAGWLLDPRYGLRVRIVAPDALRIASVARRDELTTAEAKRRVADDDASRAAFVRRLFHRDIDDPLSFDLVVNMEHLSENAASAIILEALAAKFPSALRI